MEMLRELHCISVMISMFSSVIHNCKVRKIIQCLLLLQYSLVIQSTLPKSNMLRLKK